MAKKSGGEILVIYLKTVILKGILTVVLFFVIWLLTFAHSALSETRIAMQIKARYLGQIARYTTIVLTA